MSEHEITVGIAFLAAWYAFWSVTKGTEDFRAVWARFWVNSIPVGVHAIGCWCHARQSSSTPSMVDSAKSKSTPSRIG